MATERFSMDAATPGTHSKALLAMTWLAMFALAGCASAGDPSPLDREVTLLPGGQLALPGEASLRYIAVTADSRCPPGVQCVRAGDADVAFEFVSPSRATRTVTVNTVESPTAALGEWQLRLVSLEFGDAPGVTIKVESPAS